MEISWNWQNNRLMKILIKITREYILLKYILILIDFFIKLIFNS
jgi:hypothetical protein